MASSSFFLLLVKATASRCINPSCEEIEARKNSGNLLFESHRFTTTTTNNNNPLSNTGNVNAGGGGGGGKGDPYSKQYKLPSTSSSTSSSSGGSGGSGGSGTVIGTVGEGGEGGDGGRMEESSISGTGEGGGEGGMGGNGQIDTTTDTTIGTSKVTNVTDAALVGNEMGFPVPRVPAEGQEVGEGEDVAGGGMGGMGGGSTTLSLHGNLGKDRGGSGISLSGRSRQSVGSGQWAQGAQGGLGGPVSNEVRRLQVRNRFFKYINVNRLYVGTVFNAVRRL